MNAWSFLHSLPHMDHGFSKVSNTFVLPDSVDQVWKFETNKYQQSIQMFAIIPVAIGVIYLIISFLIGCCGGIRCCNNNKTNNNSNNNNSSNNNSNSVDFEPSPMMAPNSNSINGAPLLIDYQSPVDNKPRRLSSFDSLYGNNRALKPIAMYCRFFIALFVFVAIVASFYFGYLLNKDLINIEDNWDYTYQPYDSAIHYGKSLESTIDDAIYQCHLIEATPNASALYSEVNETISLLQTSDNYISEYLSEAQKISWGDSGDMDKYRKIGVYAGIGILSFCALLLLISLCTNSGISNKNGKKFGLNTICTIILGFGMILIWIIASLEFSSSVEISDVCNNPNQAVLTAVNDTISNPSNTTWMIVKYYIYCDSTQPYNPLLAKTDLAYQQLAPLEQSIDSLVSQAAQFNIQSEAEALESDYSTMLSDLQYLNDSLRCNDINGYYAEIQNDTCLTMINDWFILYCLQFLIVLLLVIRRYFVCTMDKNNKKNKKGFVRINNNNNSNNNNDGSNNNINRNINIDNRSSIHSEGPRYGMMSNDLILDDSVSNNNNNNNSNDNNEKKREIMKFKDSEYRKCIKFLVQFSDENENERKKQSEMLKEIGYPGTLTPLPSELVDKSMAILRNGERTKDSKHKHPLLNGIEF